MSIAPPVKRRVLLSKRDLAIDLDICDRNRPQENTCSHQETIYAWFLYNCFTKQKSSCPAMELSRLDQRQTPAWDISLRRPPPPVEPPCPCFQLDHSGVPRPPTTLPIFYVVFAIEAERRDVPSTQSSL